MREGDRELELPGLRAPACIRIDRWGVPHIDAASPRDAYFLQGFNAARDRLWQIDLWRKRGLGLLAGDFGPGYLMQDRASRLLLYRGDMAREWPHYGPDAEAICTAFAEGINACIALIEIGELPLPAEFARFGTRPARWRPEDVVRIRSHALSRNALSEFARMRVARAAPPVIDSLRQPLDPEVPVAEYALMPDVDLPEDALAVYELATAPVIFSAERLAAALAEAPFWSRPGDSGVERAEGSNHWAAAPSRTTTGRALMASDPHRAYGTPSLRYLVHLEAPGLSLIGAGEPSSPGIMMGHNGDAAFSLTIFPADQEDLFVLQTDGSRFRDGDDWREMRVIREAVPVKGAPDQEVALRFAGDAPVIWEGDGIALALRTVATDAGTAPYMACLASARAASPEAFREALKGWGAPTTNQIYADVEGRILWQPSGFIPVRRGWRGVVPVAGAHGLRWDGFLTAADLPGETDPARGFVHSANEMNLDPAWDQDARPVGFEWHHDGRADRIAAVLAGGKTDVAASCALQTDTHSGHALRLAACLPAAAAGAFAGWDGYEHADSGQTLLFEVWLNDHLAPALFARVAPAHLRDILAPADPGVIADLFEGRRPDLAAALGLADPGARAALLAETLAGAEAALTAAHGDRAGWRWGARHRARFRPAAAAVHPDLGAVPPLPVGGSATTVMLTDYEPPDFTPVVGASVRMVVDVGAWDESRWINTPGQSGDLSAAHGQDLAPLWAAGAHVPMVYGAAAVAAATEATWRLRPATAAGAGGAAADRPSLADVDLDQ